MVDLLDLVFPAHCVACGVFGDWVCADCFSRIEPASAMEFFGLDGAFALGMYHDPVWRALIHGLKYRGGTCLLPRIRDLAVTRAAQGIPAWLGEKEAVFQFLPTDPLRERERGFDQAFEICRTLGPVFSMAPLWLDAVERVRNGQPAQASLEDEQLRKANVLGTYRLRQGKPLPERVILVDDVMTTGASMAAVADLLRASGVLYVYGFTLAFGA